jgi:hypothetical protein
VFSLQSELPSSHDDGRSLFADGREPPRLVPLTIFGSLVSVVIPIVIVVTITAVA